MTFTWYHSYRAAILETDWTTMQERLQSAELEIHERQAIADALRGIGHLRIEATDWQKRQKSQMGLTRTGSDFFREI
jgi:hypothetical protein